MRISGDDASVALVPFALAVRSAFMAKQKQKHRRHEDDFHLANIIPIGKKKTRFSEERKPQPIIAMTSRQAEYLGHLRTQPQIFVLGPAGTGKTWIAASYAADLYRRGTIRKIILTRPNVGCGRSLGFFPGSLEAKFAPWAVPVTDAIRDRLGATVFDIAVKNKDIEVVPFEVMRGRSWKEAFILLDEAQNTSKAEMKMFLTRVGENCISVINGDVMQCDLTEESGLSFALTLIREKDMPIPIVEFSLDDIVRSGICAMWVRAFAT
jgi:phosphate starvation-inducible PhoH-like protein